MLAVMESIPCQAWRTDLYRKIADEMGIFCPTDDYEVELQVLEIWESHRQAVMMITHDVDEAIYMSDRIILMTNAPEANIGEILTVPFSHPRDRYAIQESTEYYELRNRALDFLEQYQ